MARSIVDDVRLSVQAGRVREAATRLFAAVAASDIAATVELAHWRIAGSIVRRDLSAARELLRCAAAGGDRDATLLYANFLAAGVGGDDDFPAALAQVRAIETSEPRAARQLRLLAAMDLDDRGDPNVAPVGNKLSEMPLVMSCPGLMTSAECDYLCTIGAPTLQPSLVVDPVNGRMVPHPIRISDGTMFGVYDEDLVINALNRRLAALSGTKAPQGEPLQLLRYGPGGEYRAHMDGLAGEPNQRLFTVLTYLSTGYQGGETEFPLLGLRFRGRKGDALLFRNVDANGRPDRNTVHAGLPVASGTKLIATRWIRQARFTFPPPQPLLPEFG